MTPLQILLLLKLAEIVDKMIPHTNEDNANGDLARQLQNELRDLVEEVEWKK